MSATNSQEAILVIDEHLTEPVLEQIREGRAVNADHYINNMLGTVSLGVRFKRLTPQEGLEIVKHFNDKTGSILVENEFMVRIVTSIKDQL